MFLKDQMDTRLRKRFTEIRPLSSQIPLDNPIVSNKESQVLGRQMPRTLKLLCMGLYRIPGYPGVCLDHDIPQQKSLLLSPAAIDDTERPEL
jgi:hypothetical protein